MKPAFSENLRLVLKMLSMSAAGLASALEIDKSVVSRWLNGSVQPSAHNLSRLSALVAARIDGFTALDWERDPRSLAGMFGTDPNAIPAMRVANPGLPLAIWDQMIATTSVRGAAYEGFFRSTRPHPRSAGRYLHEYGMIRRDAIGLLRLKMGSAESAVDGWMIPLHGLLYSIAVEVNSGTLLFGIFNGSGASRLEVFDGLSLTPAGDMGRSPMATAMICERVADLTDDREADDRRFAALLTKNPLAPEGSVPEHIARHLARDFGPQQLALGGDWLLGLSLMRSMTRGPDYDSALNPGAKVLNDEI
jgi:transcriptional regulator with XRE-family HTH domain